MNIGKVIGNHPIKDLAGHILGHEGLFKTVIEGRIEWNNAFGSRSE